MPDHRAIVPRRIRPVPLYPLRDRARGVLRTPSAFSDESGSSPSDDKQTRSVDLRALEKAIERERQRLLRAQSLVGCLRLTLNECYRPEAGEPELSYVAQIAEDMIDEALAGLDPTALHL